MPGAAGGRPGASLPVRRFARRLCCEAGLPVGSGRCLCVGRGGSCAAVACLAGAAGAGPLLPGLARRWAWRGPLPSWPALGPGPLALRRAFRGARGRGSVVHCLQWCASGVRRGGLCAARAGVRCLAWAVLPVVPVVPVVRPAGGKQQSYKYSKKSMSRKHQSQHPLTTTRNFTSFFPEKATGVASKE